MKEPRTETLARATFALLVLATFAAFFVTQRLKHQATVVQQIRMNGFFSPFSSTHPVERISFKLKRADDVTVTVVDSRGDDIATLARDRHLARYTKAHLAWNGRTSAGRLAPDGSYRIRIRLREQARTVTSTRAFILHATPPRPTITQISGPAGAPTSGPAILPEPGAAAATIAFSFGGATRTPELMIYRTDVTPAQLVTQLSVAPGASSASWDGRVAGRQVAAGTYLVAIRAVDRYGNTGQTPAALPPRPGAVVPGHAGITVRYLGVEPPASAALARQAATFGVDARRGAYAWTVTRVGASRARAGGRTRAPLLRISAPGGPSGVYLLGVRTHTQAATVPFAVQDTTTQPVLVVLPQITWLGLDTEDDDGDGLPDTLDAGLTVRTQRIFAGSGLPAGFSERVAPMLTFLDRNHTRYDVTTDLALAAGSGPPLHGHRGVLLVGDERWLPANVADGLRAFVRAGGNLASLGTDSLLRSVTLAVGALVHATGPAPSDVFGAQLAPVAGAPGPITNFIDRINLFTGGTGQFSGYTSYEATQSVGTGAALVASAVTGSGRAVIVAARYGRGLVLRTGLPELASRLGADANAAALVLRIWALLSR